MALIGGSSSTALNTAAETNTDDSEVSGISGAYLHGSWIQLDSTKHITNYTTETDPDLVAASESIISQTLATAEENLHTVTDFATDAADNAAAVYADARAVALESLDASQRAVAESYHFADTQVDRAFDAAADSYAGALDFVGSVVDRALDATTGAAAQVIGAVDTVAARESTNNDARLTEISTGALNGAILIGLAAMAVVVFK